MRQNQQSEPPHFYTYGPSFPGILNPPPESEGIPGKFAYLNDLKIHSFVLLFSSLSKK